MKDTDSFGNPLPEGGCVDSGSSPMAVAEAMATTSLLMACSSAMKNGEIVKYNATTRTALITDEDGLTRRLSH